MTITAAQENERTLARILGIGEEEAAAQLARSFAITAGRGLATAFGSELMDQLARTIHPAEAGGGAVDVEIVVGDVPRRDAAKRLFISISNDSLSISREGPSIVQPGSALHALLTMVGACYAASAALALIIDGIDLAPDRDRFVVRWDALGIGREQLEAPISLSDTALVGAGAVGNAFLRAARHLNIRGGLTVLDPKAVSKGNLNRCYYFGEADRDHPKAIRLCENAQRDFRNLQLDPQVITFSELVSRRMKVRRAIVAADSRLARRSIQKDFPLEILDASTTDISEIVVHSHRQPNADACLACIYKHIPDEQARARDIASGLGVDLEDVTSGVLINEAVADKILRSHPKLVRDELIGKAFDSLFRQLCGEQALLSSTGAQVFAPFAFVSSLAGALLAIELARFESGKRFEDGTNYLFLSPWAPPHARMRRRRGRELDCEFCGNPAVEEVWPAIWPEARWPQKGGSR